MFLIRRSQNKIPIVSFLFKDWRRRCETINDTLGCCNNVKRTSNLCVKRDQKLFCRKLCLDYLIPVQLNFFHLFLPSDITATLYASRAESNWIVIKARNHKTKKEKIFSFVARGRHMLPESWVFSFQQPQSELKSLTKNNWFASCF